MFTLDLQLKKEPYYQELYLLELVIMFQNNIFLHVLIIHHLLLFLILENNLKNPFIASVVNKKGIPNPAE